MVEEETVFRVFRPHMNRKKSRGEWYWMIDDFCTYKLGIKLWSQNNSCNNSQSLCLLLDLSYIILVSVLWFLPMVLEMLRQIRHSLVRHALVADFANGLALIWVCGCEVSPGRHRFLFSDLFNGFCSENLFFVKISIKRYMTDQSVRVSNSVTRPGLVVRDPDC